MDNFILFIQICKKCHIIKFNSFSKKMYISRIIHACICTYIYIHTNEYTHTCIHMYELSNSHHKFEEEIGGVFKSFGVKKCKK